MTIQDLIEFSEVLSEVSNEMTEEAKRNGK